MRRKAHTLSGQGASSSTVVSESALVSANRTRTPSQTLKYVVIGESARALIWPPPCPELRVSAVASPSQSRANAAKRHRMNLRFQNYFAPDPPMSKWLEHAPQKPTPSGFG